jgi:membrane-associated phospholipid phosphatase
VSWVSPRERRERNRRVLLWALGGMALVAAVSLIDTRMYHVFRTDDGVVERGWYQALRSVGYLPTWIVLAVAAGLLMSRRGRAERLAALVLPAALAGAVAEILKLIIGRERPTESGAHVWRGLFSGFDDGSGLGLPSSHAAVAFGGAFALAMLWPRLRVLALAIACGCGLTRMLTGDHFLSDVVGAGLVGYGAAQVVGSWVGISPPGRGFFGRIW